MWWTDRPKLIVQRDTHDVVGKMGVSNLTGTNHPHSIAFMKRYKGKFLDGCESHGRGTGHRRRVRSAPGAAPWRLSQPDLPAAVPIIPTANRHFHRTALMSGLTQTILLIALAPYQELKQAGCSYRVGFVQSKLGLQVRCLAKKGIEVIFDYFGQRFIKLFCPLAKFPKGQRITIHLKARLVGNGRIPIVESKAAHGPAKCFPLVHIPEPKFGPTLTTTH